MVISEDFDFANDTITNMYETKTLKNNITFI